MAVFAFRHNRRSARERENVRRAARARGAWSVRQICFVCSHWRQIMAGTRGVKAEASETAISQGGLDFRLEQAVHFFAGRPSCLLIVSVSCLKSKRCLHAHRQRTAGGLAQPRRFRFSVLSAGPILFYPLKN